MLPELEILEDFNGLWHRCPKNEVIKCVWGSNNCPSAVILLEIEGSQILVGLVVGPRKGLVEQVAVVDPTKSVEADRLVFWDATASDPHVTDLYNLKQRIRGGEEAGVVIREELARVLEQIKANPQKARQVKNLKGFMIDQMPHRMRFSVSAIPSGFHN